MNATELALEIGQAAGALKDKWGYDISTPVGRITTTVDHYTVYPSRYRDGIRVNKNGCLPQVGRGSTLTSLLDASAAVSDVALYMSAKGFTDKVKGSISTLKRVQKALAG